MYLEETNVFSSRLLLFGVWSLASPGTLFEIQNLKPCPDLLNQNQNWPFKSFLRGSGHTPSFEKYCLKRLDSVSLSAGQCWGGNFLGNARPSWLSSGTENDAGEGRRQPRGLRLEQIQKHGALEIVERRRHSFSLASNVFPPKKFLNDQRSPFILKQYHMAAWWEPEKVG